MRLFPVLILLLLATPHPALGQGTGTALPVRSGLLPKVITFKPEDYGAANQNWDLSQGEDGTMYVANSSGVLAFDGVRWRTLTLPGRPVVRAVAYRDGRLYAGGYGQFGYFDELNRPKPRYTSLSRQLPQDERSEEIWNIESLDDGTIVFHSFARLYAFREDRLVSDEDPGTILFALNDETELVIPITERGLLRWSPERRFTPVPGSERLGGRTVNNLATYRGGYLVATEDTTFQLVGGTLRATELPYQINRLLPLSGGGYGAGTIDDGVYLLDDDLNVRYHLAREEGLGNNTVLALHEDLAGNLWVGLDQGLALIDRSGALLYSVVSTAEYGTVYAAAAYDDRMYIGTNQGLFQRATGGGDDYSPVPGISGQVWQLSTLNDRLICAHNDGTSVIDGASSVTLPGSPGTWVTSPHPSLDTVFGQATYTGLSVLHDGPAGLTHRRVPGTAAPFRSFSWLDDHSLLAAHAAKGLYRLRLSDDLATYASIDTLSTDGLIKPFITRFEDTILVQSLDGVYHYTQGRVDRLVRFRGVTLPAGSLCLRGRPGTGEWLLVAADRLSLYNQHRLLSRVPIRLTTDYPVALPWHGVSYLLGLNEGYAVLSPHPGPEEVPEMQLRNLPLGRSERRFEAALPVFDRPIRYRYRLSGRSKEWSDWTDQAEWELRGLWEGTYTMEVEADWFGATATEKFTIQPPWYRSPVAYFLYALLTAGLILFFYRLHRRRLRNQERRLELIRRRQLRRQQIEARNRELEDNVAAKNRELANTTLSLAKKNEMLLQLRQELDRGRADKVRHLIDRNLNSEEDWALFEGSFNNVHDAFLRRLRHRHPKLTSGDLQLAAYLKMDLASKEIAPLLHISLRGVENKRYRLRKKLDLTADQNLNQYLTEL